MVTKWGKARVLALDAGRAHDGLLAMPRIGSPRCASRSFGSQALRMADRLVASQKAVGECDGRNMKVRARHTDELPSPSVKGGLIFWITNFYRLCLCATFTGRLPRPKKLMPANIAWDAS
ncbi:hypothetical protein [Caballeronia ptereochthonis]|uniref:hypothetical protein n=1 Tax=Caballeronia ptereochthonis TaxID=1777144 RepID=UPI00117C8847|nr:hypothetical protein [Caballeronia ptereochthonis]